MKLRLIGDFYLLDLLVASGWRFSVRQARALVLVVVLAGLTTCLAVGTAVGRLSSQLAANDAYKASLLIYWASAAVIGYASLGSYWRETLTSRRLVVREFRAEQLFRALDLSQAAVFWIWMAAPVLVRVLLLTAFALGESLSMSLGIGWQASLVFLPAAMSAPLLVICARLAQRSRGRASWAPETVLLLAGYSLGLLTGPLVSSVRAMIAGSAVRVMSASPPEWLAPGCLVVISMSLAILPRELKILQRDSFALAVLERPSKPRRISGNLRFEERWLTRSFAGTSRGKILRTINFSCAAVVLWSLGLSQSDPTLALSLDPGPFRSAMVLLAFLVALATAEVGGVVLAPERVSPRLRAMWEWSGRSLRTSGLVVSAGVAAALPSAAALAVVMSWLGGGVTIAPLTVSIAATGAGLLSLHLFWHLGRGGQDSPSLWATALSLALAVPTIPLSQRLVGAWEGVPLCYSLILIGGAVWAVNKATLSRASV